MAVLDQSDIFNPERIVLIAALDFMLTAAEAMTPEGGVNDTGVTITREHYEAIARKRGNPDILIQSHGDDAIRVAFVASVPPERDPLRDFIDRLFGDGATDMAAAMAASGHTGQPDCPACAKLADAPIDTMQGSGDAPRDPASDPLWADLPEHGQTSNLETDAAPGDR